MRVSLLVQTAELATQRYHCFPCFRCFPGFPSFGTNFLYLCVPSISPEAGGFGLSMFQWNPSLCPRRTPRRSAEEMNGKTGPAPAPLEPNELHSPQKFPSAFVRQEPLRKGPRGLATRAEWFATTPQQLAAKASEFTGQEARPVLPKVLVRPEVICHHLQICVAMQGRERVLHRT